jgi:hypothetical protein
VVRSPFVHTDDDHSGVDRLVPFVDRPARMATVSGCGSSDGSVGSFTSC